MSPQKGMSPRRCSHLHPSHHSPRGRRTKFERTPRPEGEAPRQSVAADKGRTTKFVKGSYARHSTDDPARLLPPEIRCREWPTREGREGSALRSGGFRPASPSQDPCEWPRVPRETNPACSDRQTWSSVEFFVSHPGPSHVPSSDRHTFPSAYRFGFRRSLPHTGLRVQRSVHKFMEHKGSVF